MKAARPREQPRVRRGCSSGRGGTEPPEGGRNAEGETWPMSGRRRGSRWAVRRRRRRSAAAAARERSRGTRARRRRAAGGARRRRCRPASARSSRRLRVARAARVQAGTNGSPANARFGRARRHVGRRRALAGSYAAKNLCESIVPRLVPHARAGALAARLRGSFFVSGGWC